jgi:YVTN family beta-propeller protein
VKSTSISVSPDGSILAVANPDSNSVTLVALPDETVVAEVLVGQSPRTLAFSPSSEYLYVTSRQDDSVSRLSIESRAVEQTFPACDEPHGVVVADDETLYVSCSGDALIQVFDGASGEQRGSLAVAPDPKGLALSADGTQLYVSHFFSGELSIIATNDLTITKVVTTELDGNLASSVTLNADETRAYLPQTRSNVTNESLLFDTTVFPIVSAINLETQFNIPAERIHLDIVDKPVGLPFDTLLANDTTLVVMNAASNDVSVIDLERSRGLAHIEVGDFPSGMALSADGSLLYVNNALAGTVSVVDTVNWEVLREMQVTRLLMPEDLLNGKRLFHSSDRTELARDQWIACATCHFDGEMDRRTWFFRDGPRNSTSLLGVGDTLPIHWSGDLDELQDVESTIRTIQAGTGLTDGPDNCAPACDQAPPNAGRSQDLDDLAAYMAALKFPENPNREADGDLSEAAERGEALFHSEETGCANCHAPPLYRDGLRHDVGTLADERENKVPEFDTPSLRGIYRTAPYLHDGSALTLMDVLTSENAGDLHGQTSQLDASQKSDLVAFLESIDGPRAVEINPGMNDAWANPDTLGQGMLVTVLPTHQLVFAAWFTFDVDIHPDATANIGAPGHRWLTALGPFSGNRAQLKIENSTGGSFGSESPDTHQDSSYGTLDIEFSDCGNAMVSYDIPAAGQTGSFAMKRVADDNMGLCETLAQ